MNHAPVPPARQVSLGTKSRRTAGALAGLVLVLALGAARAQLPDDVAATLAEAVARHAPGVELAQAELIARGELSGSRPAAEALLARAAAGGDPHAAFVLGALAGETPAALAWWRSAADAGHPDAQYNLGLALLPQDPAGAERLWAAAAAKDHALACFALGTRRAALAPDEARVLLECAARQGYAPAQFNLATLLARGAGGPPDVPRARALYAAAAADFPPAAAALESLPATRASTPEALALHDADWLLAQPASAYTVQVAAGANAEVLQALLRDAGLTGDAACVLEHPDARQAWSALVGVHAERDAAERALTALPAALRANAPWVRRLSAVHKALRAAEASARVPAAAR